MAYQLNSGKLELPVRGLLYGPEGIGKTTFAADWLRARGGALIDTENGSGRINVMRYPVPSDWPELLNMVRDAKNNPDLHALGVDTLDAAERMCAEYICSKNGWNSLEDPGYGGGYKRLWEEFSRLITALNAVISAGKDVILTAHAAMRKFEQPDQMGSYDRWELKLQNSQKCSTAALVKEWADLVLFANYETLVVTSTDGKTRKAAGGKRVVYTSHHPCWDAKNRFGLPEEVKLDFASVAPYLFGAQSAAPDPVQQEQPKPAPAQKKTSVRKKASADPAPETITGPTPAAPAEPAEPIPMDVQPMDTAPSAADLEGIPEVLAQLMIKDKINAIELQAWTAKEGYYPPEVKLKVYDPEYLSKYLPSVWTSRIVPEVTAFRKELPF
jgi:hypothetical protein